MTELIPCPACTQPVPRGQKFCHNCGQPLLAPEAAASAPGDFGSIGSDAERRQVTVVFCDLVGSTDLSTRLDPEDLAELIGAYHQAAGREVARYGGNVAQYLGDGILIYFGYPTAFEDGPVRAVATARGIIDAVQELDTPVLRDLGTELRVRVGIHTGVVVVGGGSGAPRGEKLALGETPNVAARIQGLARPNEVLLSDVTARLVASRYRLEPRGEHSVKGLDRPLAVHTVLGEKRQVEDDLGGARSTFVNRVPQTQALKAAWDAARQGRGSVLLVTGAAGIGKSRLIQSLRQALDHVAGEESAVLLCSPYHTESAFHPFLEHIRSACRFRTDDTPLDRLAKLQETVAATDPGLLSNLAVFVTLLGLPESPDHEPVNPMELKGLAQEAIIRWVTAQAAANPLLVIVEDLHWADASSLEVLRLLADRIGGTKILFAMTARPNFHTAWSDATEAQVHRIELEPLADEHVAEIIGNISVGDVLPDELVRELVSRVDGVPIFAEELAKSMVGSPDLAGPVAGAGFEIPNTLQDSLLARLDRLGEGKRVAQVVSVLGRDFDYDTAYQLCGVQAAVLQQALDALIEQGVLREGSGARATRYRFSHALLQEAAYESLVRSDRRSLHRKVGEILETRYLTDSSAHPDTDLLRSLGHHWALSLHPSRPEPRAVVTAVGYLIGAAERGLAVSGYEEARVLLDRALTLLEQLPEGKERDELELTARLRMSRVYQATVGWASDAARDVFDRCRELCLRLGHRPELSNVLFGYWQYNLFRAKYPKALTLANELHTEAVRRGDNDLLLQSRVALSNSQFWLCHLDAASENAEFVLQQYDPARHASHAIIYGMDPGVYAYMFAVWTPWIQGRPAAAARRHDDLMTLAELLDHPFSMALALNTSCCHYLNDGDLVAAEDAANSLLSLAQRHSLPVYEMFAVLFRGWALARQGRVGEVVDGVSETYGNYVRYVGGLAQTYAALMAADVLRLAGRFEEALGLLDAVLEVAEDEDCCELVYHGELLRSKAEILLTGWPERVDEASRLLDRSHELAVERGQPPLRLRAAVAQLGVAEQHGGNLDAALDLVRAAIDAFEEGEGCRDVQGARAVVARLS